MESSLRTAFGAPFFDVTSNAEAFHAAANHWQFDSDIGVTYCEYNAGVDIVFPESSLVRQHFCLGGQGTQVAGNRSAQLTAGRTCIMGSASLRATLASGYRQFVLRMESRRLEETWERMTGRRAVGGFAFEPDVFANSAAIEAAGDLLQLLVKRLDDGGQQAPRFVYQELVGSMVVSFLGGSHHNHSKVLQDAPKSIAAWQVLQAEGFLEANWNRPVTMETLAEALSCSVRSLFKTFQDARGYTPMVFLRRVRLKHARKLLMDEGDPRTTVTGVALATGFQNIGHFARYYRIEFRELPSDTLQRTKGLRASRGS